jgi:hypothetical protein
MRSGETVGVDVLFLSMSDGVFICRSGLRGAYNVFEIIKMVLQGMVKRSIRTYLFVG